LLFIHGRLIKNLVFFPLKTVNFDASVFFASFYRFDGGMFQKKIIAIYF